MGIVRDAELTDAQESLFSNIISGFVAGMYPRAMKDIQERQQLALQTATWVNSAHVANKSK